MNFHTKFEPFLRQLSSVVQKSSYLIPAHSCFSFALSLRTMVNTADLSDCNYLNKNACKIKLLGIFHLQKLFWPISIEIWLYYRLASKTRQAWWAVSNNYWFLQGWVLIVSPSTLSDHCETIKDGCTYPFLELVNSSTELDLSFPRKWVCYFIYSLLLIS